MMNQEIKAKWVEALRSGKYEQGRFQLLLNDKYCCLGVLCEVQGVPTSLDLWDEAYPPMDLRAGITEGAMTTLSQLNDTRGQNFNEIADWIEQNL